MKNEYEAKFLEVNEVELKRKLKSFGARLDKPRQLSKRLIFESPELRKTKSWIRLRAEGEKVTLTLKQVTEAQTIHGTKEAEVGVDDFNVTAELLRALGLEQKNYQENFRERWRLGDVIYDFDSWPGIPGFLEIEGPDEDTVKKACIDLNLDYGDAWFGSIDKIYLEKYNRDILKEENLVFKSDSN